MRIPGPVTGRAGVDEARHGLLDRPIGRIRDDARRVNGRAVNEADAGREGSPVAEAPKPAPPRSPVSRVAGIVAVTVIEGASIYAWLRLHEAGHQWWGLLALIAGEVLETAALKRFIDRGGIRRWGTAPRGVEAVAYLRKVQRTMSFAGNAEIAVWVLWLICAQALGQPIAAVALLVAMHLKHQVETAAARDVPYRAGLFSAKGTFGSAMEVAGAVACLALILDGRPVEAAVALGVGLLLEHALLIDTLRWEMIARDIRLPRDTRWRDPLRPNPRLAYAASHFAPFWALAQRIAPLQRRLNRSGINSRIARIEPRPNPLSAMAPYTSWASLTDRTFSSRHLPPVAPEARPSPQDGPPTSAEVARLFLRGEEMVQCPKSTVLFSFFAQWFTDGFLRTERDDVDHVRNTTKNESNHEIDLAQLYGMSRAATEQLRGERGLLKHQVIDGEEYPPYYCTQDGPAPQPKPEFDALPRPLALASLRPEQQRTLFAMGTDTRNIGFVSFNVLFLREHNRIARRLGDEYPAWDDDRVFETTRNILIVVLLKIVVEEFINHIHPNHFQFRLTPGCFEHEPWHRPNWMAVEFNLLYRWHSLVPSTFHLAGEHLPASALINDTTLLTSAGLGRLMAAASAQPAGRIGLRNTDSLLVRVAEQPSIEQGRAAALASYNDYRRLCRYPPVTSFEEISSDPRTRDELAALYPGGVDDVELFVGLFAEDAGPNAVLPPLLSTMVAFDAFSQALTNPLLAPRVFNEETFSPVGMRIIERTSSISEIVERNVPREPGRDPYFVSLTRRDYKRIA